jgi:excisionase family DNA binding protein
MPIPRRQPAQRKSSAANVRITRSAPNPAAQPSAFTAPPSPNATTSVPASTSGPNGAVASGKRQHRAPISPDFLSIPEFAARLRISPKTVQRLINSKDPACRIRAVRVGGQIRIPLSEYYRYAASLPAARP